MQRENRFQQFARILVIGAGGRGSRSVARLLQQSAPGVKYITIDTDEKVMPSPSVAQHITIGDMQRGTGGNIAEGAAAAAMARPEIAAAIDQAELVFITAGMGGGTGTGAAPIISETARALGALTIAIVTMPYQFEHRRRQLAAEQGIARLREATDTMLVIPGEQVLERNRPVTNFDDTVFLADNILAQCIQSICELVNTTGLINVDFADVRTIMSHAGAAVVGTGRSSGPEKAIRAARKAADTTYMGTTIDGAQGVVFNVRGGPDMSLLDVEEAAAVIRSRIHPDANLILGATVDGSMIDEIEVTVIATDFQQIPAVRTAVRSETQPGYQREPVPVRLANRPVAETRRPRLAFRGFSMPAFLQRS